MPRGGSGWGTSQPKWKNYLGWFVLIALIALLFLGAWCDKAHAQFAVVSFNDAEQLAAISDSITNVCDTVDGNWVVVDEDDLSIFYRRTSIPLIITCRELVCVAVVEKPHIKLHPHGQFIYPQIPGTAIITWRGVKR